MRRPSAETLYYGLSFGLRMPTRVVLAVYLVRTLHLSPLQLVLMGTAMEGAVFLFEVPTGVVADTYSRRLSLIIGYLGMGTAWLVVGFVSTPWLVIVLWALWGIAYTFTSGAEEAWVADEVGAERAGRVFLRAARFGQAGAVVGLLLQVAVGVASLRAGVVLGGAFTIVCGLACILLMEEHGFRRRPREERRSPFHEMRTTASAGARYARAAPVIVLLVAVGVFAGASSEGFDRLKAQSRAMMLTAAPPAIVPTDNVVCGGSKPLSGRARERASTERRAISETISAALLGCVVFELGAMLVFAVAWSAWAAIAGLLGVFLARNLASPLYTIWLNEQITDSSVRATVFSISGQADAIGQAAGGPVLGVIGNVWGIRAALLGGATALAPAAVLFARAIRRHGGGELRVEELPEPTG